MACFNPKEIEKGTRVFADHYRATENFFQSSEKAVKYLNDNGVQITKNEFDSLIRDNFINIITADRQYWQVNRTMQAALKSVQKELGVTGKYTSKKRGKFLASDVGIEVQEKLQRIADAVYGSEPVNNLQEDEGIIAQMISDGKTNNDPKALREAVAELKAIRATGKSKVQELIDADKAEIEQVAKDLARDWSRLTVEKQKLRALALQVNKGEADYQDLVIAASDLDLELPPDGDVKEVSAQVLRDLGKEARHPLHKTMLARASKLWGDWWVQTTRDLSGTLNRISRRGSKKFTEGITETAVHDRMREADYDKAQYGQDYAISLGQVVAKAYGIKIPTFKGITAKIQEIEFFDDIVEDQAMQSSKEIDTGLFSPDGREIILQKGELMQLYAHAQNPYLSDAMARAGLTVEQVIELSNQFLTSQDKEMAVALVNEFYRDMYEKENPIYKREFHHNMPHDENYSGPAHYQGDSETTAKWHGSTRVNMSKTNLMLSNAAQRKEHGKALDLHVNIFANARERAKASAQFRSGFRAHKIISAAIGHPEAKNTLKEANLLNYSSIIQSRVNEHFELARSLGKLPAFLNIIKGNWVGAKLAIKPKVGLNQTASVMNWGIEEDFINGIMQEGHKDLPKGFIIKYIFDNNPEIRQRYKNENIIGLESNLEASKNEISLLRKIGGRKGKKGLRWAKAIITMNMKIGDGIGIVGLGQYYFRGAYNSFRNQGLDHETALKKAMLKFTKHYQKTQQSYKGIDKSNLQNNPYGGLFVMFLNTPYQYGRVITDSFIELSRGITGKEMKGSAKYHIGRLLVYHVASGMMWHFLSSLLPKLIACGKLDASDYRDLALAGVKGPWVDNAFVFGSYIRAIYNYALDVKFRSDALEVPINQSLGKIRQQMEKYWKLSHKDELTDKQEEDLAKIPGLLAAEVASLFGIPIDGAKLFADGVTGMLDGDISSEDFMKLMGFSDYIIKEVAGCGVEPPKGKSAFGKKGSAFDKGGKSAFDKKGSAFD